MRQDRQCFYCGVYENIRPRHLHHGKLRSTDPGLIDDPTNLIPLCELCHRWAHSSQANLEEILRLWKIHLKTKHQES